MINDPKQQWKTVRRKDISDNIDLVINKILELHR